MLGSVRVYNITTSNLHVSNRGRIDWKWLNCEAEQARWEERAGFGAPIWVRAGDVLGEPKSVRDRIKVNEPLNRDRTVDCDLMWRGE